MKNRTIDRQTRTLLLAGLSLGLLTASIHAATIDMAAEAPSPAAMAAQIQTHMTPAGLDLSSLSQGTAFGDAAIVEALSDQGRLQALESYVSAAPEGAAAAAQLRQAFEKAQNDPQALRAIMSAQRTLGKKIDAESLDAFFDHAHDGGVETVEAELVEPGSAAHASGLGRFSSRGPASAAADIPAPGGRSVMERETPDEIVVLAPEDEAKVSKVVDQLFNIDGKSVGQVRAAVEMVNSWGVKEQFDAAKQSQLLTEKLGRSEGDDGQINQELGNLMVQVDRLNPAKVKLLDFKRIISKLPVIGAPARKAVVAQQSGAGLIEDIVTNLEGARDEIIRTNDETWDDLERMDGEARALTSQIDIAARVVGDFKARLDSDQTISPERRRLLEQQVLLPLAERLADMRTQQATNTDAMTTGHLAITNNETLVRVVNRAVSTLPSILGKTIANAKILDRQQNTFEMMKAVTTSTEKLMLSNAERVQRQGALIQQQQGQAMISPEVIEKVHGHLKAAIDDVSAARRKALPEILANVKKLERLNREGDKINEQMLIASGLRQELIGQSRQAEALPRPDDSRRGK